MKFKNPEGQIARWIETLAAYDIKSVHRPGRLHNNADGLSRIPCKQCGRMEDDIQCDSLGDDAHLHALTVENDVNQSMREAQNSNSDIVTVKSWVKAGARPDAKGIAIS